jgi:hypothetical protein
MPTSLSSPRRGEAISHPCSLHSPTLVAGFDVAAILSGTGSPVTDPELSQWLRRASESGSTPMFAHTVTEAAFMACIPDYLLFRPVLVELKRRYPGRAQRCPWRTPHPRLTQDSPEGPMWPLNRAA